MEDAVGQDACDEIDGEVVVPAFAASAGYMAGHDEVKLMEMEMEMSADRRVEVDVEFETRVKM